MRTSRQVQSSVTGHGRFMVAAVATGWLMAAAAALAEQDGAPEELLASDWSSIRAAYEANRHAVFAVKKSAGVSRVYQARNPGQQWRTQFDGRGFETTPDGGGWSWGLQLVSYGCDEKSLDCLCQSPDRQGGVGSRTRGPARLETDRSLTVAARKLCAARKAPAVRKAGAARNKCATVNACGQRVAYAWDEDLTEWYVNNQRGLEHGYTVHRRPACHGCGSRAAPGQHCSQSRGTLQEHAALQFTLAVRGHLRPRISADGRNVTFVNSAGVAAVTYNGLTVFDANGATIPAWFEEPPLPRVPSPRTPVFRIVIDDSNAAYPLTIDPIAQQAYLKASNTEAFDEFGSSVAISGNTVVVGAPGEDSNAMGVNGNQADNSASDSGAAYVFVRDGGGNWSQQAYLKASNTEASDIFGRSVAVSGNTVVVGAPFEDSSATGVNGDQNNNGAGNSGAVYVFTRNGTTWSQQAYLKASNTGAGDSLGFEVSISGDTIVAGAQYEDSSATGVNGNGADNSATDSGAAYVFVRDGTAWSQQAYLKASNTGAGDLFATSVSISGNTVVVGAILEDSNATGIDGDQSDNSALNAGAAYVFDRNAGVWSQQAYLKASNTGAGDLFGLAASIWNDTVVVTAYWEDSSATGVSGNQADNSASDSGAAYLFVRTAGVWSQQAYLKASNTGAGDQFGYSVAVSGDSVVVGTYQEDSSTTGVNGNGADNSATNSGAAYVFAIFGICCPGDMNGDGVVDGNDTQLFVNKMLSGGACP
jgi:hypothetical protein